MARSNLPPPNAPLMTDTGEQVLPVSVTPSIKVSIPSNTEAKRLVSNTRRKLADLPAIPSQMNSFAVVLVYTASGLSDSEISTATGFTVEQVNKIRALPAYASLEDHVITAVKQQAAEDTKEILARGQTKAANYLVDLVEKEDVPDLLKLKAADSILDRTGHKAADKIDIRTMHMQSLRVEIVDKRGTDVPVIEHME